MPDNDFTPIVLPLILLFFCVMLMLIGIGIVIGVICAACGAALVALGIVSSSALLALLRRRVSTGIRALHYQLAMLTGLLFGAGATWVGAGLLQLPLRQRYVLLMGAAGGLTAGAFLALASDYAVRLACHRLSESFATPQISDTRE